MKKADYIITSERIFDAVSDVPFSGIIAISGRRIIAVGSKNDMEKYISSDTKVYDFGEKLVLPGLIDAHDHWYNGAINLSEHMCDNLVEAKSEAECVEMIKAYAEAHPDEERIRGCGWFPAAWGDAPLPSKRSLDEAIPDRPVYLMSADSHTAWLNSKALAEIGTDPKQELVNGTIGVFENGELNGLLFEPEACAPAMEKMMELDIETLVDLNEAAYKTAASYGLTGVSEMSAFDLKNGYLPIEMWKRLEAEGKLLARTYMYVKRPENDDYTDILKAQSKFNSDMFKINGIKDFIDGVTSTFTGFLLEPYTDNVKTRGDGCPFISEETLSEAVKNANAAGLSVRLHCIGDAAVREALNAYEASEKINTEMDFNNTIEHIEIIDPQDISRFSKLKVVASMQPCHLILDENEKEYRCGKRSQYAWVHKSLLQAGATIGFGTDFPIVGINPFMTIHDAVTRTGRDGLPKCINMERECLTVAEALKAHTYGAACAYNMEKETGTLEKGKLADIIVLEDDIFKIDPASIHDTKVLLTMIDGRIVYEMEH